jgi:hypothetical protein
MPPQDLHEGVKALCSHGSHPPGAKAASPRESHCALWCMANDLCSLTGQTHCSWSIFMHGDPMRIPWTLVTSEQRWRTIAQERLSRKEWGNLHMGTKNGWMDVGA